MLATDAIVRHYGVAVEVAREWSEWGDMDDLIQASLVGLVTAANRANWVYISAVSDGDEAERDRMFLGYARRCMVSELRVQAMLAASPVSASGRHWGVSYGLPGFAELDEADSVAVCDGSEEDAEVFDTLLGLASVLGLRAETVVMGRYLYGSSDSAIGELLGLSEEYVRRLRLGYESDLRRLYYEYVS
jgi:DNA-directed RNA polymerase specialized sigma subunit